MKNILHILNGDGTANGFKEANIDGDTLIWREMMMEGPVSGFADADSFWPLRSRFITANYGHQPDNRKHILSESKSKKVSKLTNCLG